MNEIDIIKNIKVDLAKELMEGKYWTADEVLAMVAVYLCPALDSVKLSKDEDLTRKHGTLRDIYKAIKAWGNKRKRHLMEYSRDGLFELFKCEWAAPLSIIEKKRLLNGITLIKSIEDDGHLSYRGNETVYKNLIKTGASSLDLQYGKKEYCPEKKSASTNNEETTMKSNRQEAYVQEEKLKNVWSKISGQPDYKEKMPLIWKLCIPYQIYMQLKESLTEYLQTTSEKPRVILKKHAEKILVYVALWYRWGYKGGGNQENALDVLGNTRIKINHVWNNCSDIQKYLYKTEDSTSYLYSAYVLGGFPLQYINDSGRFDSLFQKIYSLDENAITEEGMKEVSDAFDQNNATYTQSFQQGSFREYVTSLLHDEETIAEEDNDNALVARYRQLIKNGKIERNNKIFHHEWLYYINTECESIECYFKLKIGCKNMYITPPKGVGIDVSDFFIGIETDNGKASRQRIRFSRINDDTFMGWGNIDMLEMNVPQLAVNKINVCIYTGEDAKDKKIVETIPTPDCIQLYNTKKPYEWSSDKSKKKQLSSLLFLEGKYEIVKPKDCQLTKFNEKELNWFCLLEGATLKESASGKELQFQAYQGDLGVTYKPCPIRYEGIKEVKTVKYIKDGQCSYFPLIVGNDGIQKVTFYPFNENESPKSYDNPCRDIGIIMRYKQSGENEYKDFKKEEPGNGKIRLEVMLEGEGLSRKIDCFYIKSSDFIKLDFENKRIKFSDCCETILVPISYTAQGQDGNIEIEGIDGQFECLQRADNSKRYYDDLKYDRSEDTIPVLIPSNEGHLCLNVWRARQSKELHFENHWLTDINEGGKAFDIPLIIKDIFNVRILNPKLEERVKYGAEHRRIEENFYFDPQANPRIRIEETIKIQDYPWIEIYKYKTTMWNGLNKFKVSGNYESKYQFYYWNYRDFNSQPQKLSTIFTQTDENSKYGIMQIKIPQKNEGIVFQSLKDSYAPHYLSPIFLSNCKWDTLINYKKWFSSELYLSIYRIAIEHKIYFTQFPPMAYLAGFKGSSYGALLEFINSFLASKNRLLNKDDANFHRFAQELCFDLLMIPRNDLRSKISCDNQEAFSILLKESPLAKGQNEKVCLRKIVDEYYWKLKKPQRKLSERDQSSERKLINYMLGHHNIKKKSFFDRKSDLEAFASDPHLFSKILDIIENPINNLL